MSNPIRALASARIADRLSLITAIWPCVRLGIEMPSGRRPVPGGDPVRFAWRCREHDEGGDEGDPKALHDSAPKGPSATRFHRPA